MYFKDFPTIFYQFDIGSDTVLKTIRDITANVRLRKELLSNITIYDSYDIQEGDTPEIIAAKYYGSSQLHWAIMLANETFDYQVDFPMADAVLQQYVVDKYNRLDATSWSYDGTSVTATIPSHGIDPGYTSTVTVLNAFVLQTDATEKEVASYLSGAMEVLAITNDTVVFTAAGAITGVPVGGLTLYTLHREYDTHHYELDGYVVNAYADHSIYQEDVSGAVEVQNYDYEVTLNDSKRRIKLITPSIVAQIARELTNLLGA